MISTFLVVVAIWRRLLAIGIDNNRNNNNTWLETISALVLDPYLFQQPTPTGNGENDRIQMITNKRSLNNACVMMLMELQSAKLTKMASPTFDMSSVAWWILPSWKSWRPRRPEVSRVGLEEPFPDYEEIVNGVRNEGDLNRNTMRNERFSTVKRLES
jgi:hypothetical protein